MTRRLILAALPAAAATPALPVAPEGRTLTTVEQDWRHGTSTSVTFRKVG